VTVGPRTALATTRVRIRDLRLHGGADADRVKLRYRSARSAVASGARTSSRSRAGRRGGARPDRLPDARRRGGGGRRP
jgi:hypothetical protein